MLSRVADSLYWMTRYVERTDCILRMIRRYYLSSLEKFSEEEFTWMPVLKTFGFLTDEQAEAIQYDTPAVLRYLVCDKGNMNSILNLISKSRENARGMQDHITIEVWESINSFYLNVKEWIEKDFNDSPELLNHLNKLLQNSLMYYGVSEVTMPRTEGWSYINMGKCLERAIQSADILDINFQKFNYDLSAPLDRAYWQHLLKSVSGFELYLKTYRTGSDTENIVDLILFNSEYPRSIMYSISRLQTLFERLRKTSAMDTFLKIDHLIGKAKYKVMYTDIEQIRKRGLQDYLNEIKTDLYLIGSEFHKNYFAYS